MWIIVDWSETKFYGPFASKDDAVAGLMEHWAIKEEDIVNYELSIHKLNSTKDQ